MPDAPSASRVLLAVATGGALGALGRHSAGVLAPHQPGDVGWTVLAVNVVGCALLGALIGSVETGRMRHPLARPFLGTGVLGGFTTFSAFTFDAHSLTDAGRLPAALAYVVLTVAGCVGAAVAGVRLVQRP
jgi:CrcB protein